MKSSKNNHFKKKRKIFKNVFIIVDFELFQKKTQKIFQNFMKSSTFSSENNFMFASFTFQSFITFTNFIIAFEGNFDMKIEIEHSITFENFFLEISDEEQHRIQTSKNKQRTNKFFTASSNVFSKKKHTFQKLIRKRALEIDDKNTNVLRIHISEKQIKNNQIE